VVKVIWHKTAGEAHWRHLANTIELVLPSAHQSPQPKRQIGRFRSFCTAHGRKCGAVFAQMTAECRYTLQWDAPFPLKLAPSHGEIWTPSNTWFPRLTRVLNPNGILIGSAVLAGLTSVTDRPTDHATRSVTIDRIYVPSTVTRSKNGKSTFHRRPNGREFLLIYIVREL